MINDCFYVKVGDMVVLIIINMQHLASRHHHHGGGKNNLSKNCNYLFVMVLTCCEIGCKSESYKGCGVFFICKYLVKVFFFALSRVSISLVI